MFVHHRVTRPQSLTPLAGTFAKSCISICGRFLFASHLNIAYLVSANAVAVIARNLTLGVTKLRGTESLLY